MQISKCSMRIRLLSKTFKILLRSFRGCRTYNNLTFGLLEEMFNYYSSPEIFTDFFFNIG